jgi:hypothetical protein
MAITIKNLGAGYLGTATQTSILAGTVGKSILVKNIILTNTNLTTARTVTISAYLKTTGSLVEYPITPKSVSIGPKQQLVLDHEITLQSSGGTLDSLTGIASMASEVSYVINGMLRDV